MEGYENFPVGKRRSKEVALAANIEESFGFDEKLSPAFSLRPQTAPYPRIRRRFILRRSARCTPMLRESSGCSRKAGRRKGLVCLAARLCGGLL